MKSGPHAPLLAGRPLGWQMHLPPVQVAALSTWPKQLLPHSPQFSRFVCRSTQIGLP